jgi:hypothetical protein
MKKVSRPLVLSSIVLLFITSCKKDLSSPQPTTDSTSFNSVSSSSSLNRWYDRDRGQKTAPTTTSPTTTKPTTPSPTTTPTTPTTTTTTPITGTTTLTVGANGLVIDGNVTKYAAGTQIIVQAGTYAKSVTIQNLTGVTVSGNGVILDGVNNSSAGYYNSLNLSNLNNVTVSGFTVQNNGYHSLYFNSRMVGLILNGCSFINDSQGFYIQNNIVWDKTDNTVVLLNCAIRGCTFNNATMFGGQGGINGSSVTDLMKNLEISGNNFSNVDGGDLFQLNAVDGFNIFNNTVKNVNATNNNDNRLFMLMGNGVAHDNSFNTIEGHAIAVWPVSFGSTVTTSNVYNNTVVNSRRYSAFEFQEFAAFNIPGTTTKSNLIVNNNTCGNLNTDQWTGYPGTFIDNYMFGLMGGTVTLTNNKGSNFFPVPVTQNGQLVLWNLAQPAVVSGNTYN